MRSRLILLGLFALVLLYPSGLFFSAAAQDAAVFAEMTTETAAETTAPAAFAEEEAATALQNTGEQTENAQEEQTLLDLPVVEVELTRELGVGETMAFPLAGMDGPWTFYTSDPEVAAVDGNGLITAAGLGSAEITAYGSNEIRTGVLEVAEAPESLSLSASSLSLGEGEKLQLTVTLSENAGGTVQFLSADDSIVSVDADGTVTAVRSGKATVTAKAYNGVFAQCRVQVKKAPDSVSLPLKKLEIAAGDTYTLSAVLPKGTASRITYVSSEPEVLEIDSAGNVRTFDPGTVTVKAKTFNGKVARCKVKIVPPPERYALNVTDLKLGLGESFALEPNVISYHTTVSVSRPEILSLSERFEITAKKLGKTTLKFKNYDGRTAKVKVKVYAAPESLALKTSALSLQMGERISLTCRFPKGSFANGVMFRSANPAVAEIDAQGRLWAKLTGRTTVTATAYNGVSDSVSVTVGSMSVPFVSQLPSYPTGCEGASCTALLRYYGVDITLKQMIDAIPRQNIQYKNGRRIGPDINKKFVGNPAGSYTSRTPGYGAFSPCIAKSLNKVLKARKSPLRAKTLSGSTFEELIAAVCEGKPAIVWATYRMHVPSSVNSWYIPNGDGTYRYFEYPRGTHVFVLKGVSAETVTLMDPILGTVSYSRSTFEKRWNLLGRQAVVLEQED